MKKAFLVIFFSLSIIAVVKGQEIPYLKSSAFNAGETIKYKLKYGFFTAAEATIQVVETDIKFDNNPTYHLTVQGSTSGTFDIFYKVRNRYDSYIDQKTYTPYLYTENVHEGNYVRNDRVRFYQNEQKIVGKKGTFKSPEIQTFDLVSAYYFARNLDLSKVQIGDTFKLNYFLDDEVTPLSIEYIGKEVIRTNLGKIRCLKFSPSIKPGRIFRKDSKLFLWVTDDANRIPVKAQAELVVGSIIMDISSATGLKKPLETVR